MNARQKAKKYKRMYEALSARSKPPILLNEKEYKIDTLNGETMLTDRFIAEGNAELLKQIILEVLTQNLAEHFNEYINYDIEHLSYKPGHCLRYWIKVARRLPKLEAKIITRGNCMACGKELTEGIFLCKECREKSRKQEEGE